MLEIAFIRRHPDLVQQVAEQKNISFRVEELLEADDRRRRLLQEVEQLRKERNQVSTAIGALIGAGKSDEAARAKEEARRLQERLALLEPQLTEAEAAFEAQMMLVPNPVSPDTPIGQSDADNVEVRRSGTIPSFDFVPLDHVELGERLGLFDLPRGVKVGGSRNYFLTGLGFHLHRAVQQLAVDLLTERGFTPMDVPMIVREEALRNTGFFPLGRDQTFEIDGENKFLIGTSEVSLVSFYADEIVDVAEPIRLAAVSSCYRAEVGSAGRDVRGLYRVHQFAKVEQVILCRGDDELSERLLQELTRNAEELLGKLELPYRVMAVCSGDMSQKTYKQYDLETWMPSRGNYGETHSSSNVRDFQARRARIRYKDETGTLRYCHTLNNTAVASPRILIPLLECHQQEDGTVVIPRALQSYLNGLDRLAPKQG